MNQNDAYLGYLFSVHDFIIGNLWIDNGVHIGVMIFIVLSGYVIHNSQINIQFNQYDSQFIKNFLLRRFLRIYPILLFGLLLGSLHTVYTVNDISFIAHIVNFFNSIFLLYSIYPVLPPDGNPILVTVIVEVFLYVTYVIALRMIFLKKWFMLFGIFLFLYFLNHYITHFVSINTNWYWTFHNFYSFAIYWFIGAFFAQDKSQLIKRDLFFISSVLVSMIFLSYLELYIEVQLILQAILIAYFIRIIVYYKLEVKTLAYVGKISFSLYVTHMVLMDLFQNFLNFNNYILTPFIHLSFVAVCFVFAFYTYKYIELPVHTYARNLRK